MVYQTGFRPAGSVLGARTMSIPTSFPSFIQPFPTVTAPGFPSAYEVTGPQVVTPGAVPAVVPATAAPSSSYAPIVTLLVAGGIAIAGVALLVSAIGPKS